MYWTIVFISCIIVPLITYSSFRVIWFGIHPFNYWIYNHQDFDTFSERTIQKKTIKSVFKFYKEMLLIILGLLILCILSSMVSTELCSISNILKQQYIAAVLVLISYVILCLSLNLFSLSCHTKSGKLIVYILISAIINNIAIITFMGYITHDLMNEPYSTTLIFGIFIVIDVVLWLSASKISKDKVERTAPSLTIDII